MGKEFSGTSKNGDFQEALSKAIDLAKRGLGPTDFVRWKLTNMTGENGGFVLQNDLTVTIDAEV
jgi:hypothetical protein